MGVKISSEIYFGIRIVSDPTLPEMDKENTSGAHDTTSSDKNVVRSLAKGFRILEAFKPDEAEMTLSQIAARANLDSGTTFRLINTLLSLGYLMRVEGARRYHLGLKVLDLGFSTIAGMAVARNARPILRSLLDGIAESASLDVLDGTDIVRIERVFKNGHKPVVNPRLGFRQQGLGLRTSLERTVMGQAVMAYQSDSHAKGATGQIKKRGYAHGGGKAGEEDYIIAVPSLDADSRPRAVVSVTCASSLCSEEEFIKGCAKRVVLAARRIGRLFDLEGQQHLT
jgi:IclR family transcriptional regulator, pca regulon regulatory protein